MVETRSRRSRDEAKAESREESETLLLPSSESSPSSLSPRHVVAPPPSSPSRTPVSKRQHRSPSVSSSTESVYSTPGNKDHLLEEFPDDEVEDRVGREDYEEQPRSCSSLDSIGKVDVIMSSLHPDDERHPGERSISRQELSPIPFSSSATETPHLPVLAEDDDYFDMLEEGTKEDNNSPSAVVTQPPLEAVERPSEETEGKEQQDDVDPEEGITTMATTPPAPPRIRMDDDDDVDDRGGRDDVNDSVASKEGSVASRGSSLGETDIERMTEELGASSLEFIRRIRAAAFRRKLDVTRSRDSLAAKERERDQAIAASQAAAQKKNRRNSEPVKPSPAIPISNEAPSYPRSTFRFHARPVPETTGAKGSGGLSGVPKVEKKPTTVPHSPLLGPRRLKQHQQRTPKDELPPQRTIDDDDDDDDSSRSPSPKRDQNIFRALPLPVASTETKPAGIVGVPNVPKRPTTVPKSPLLGFRRRPHSARHAQRASGAATSGIPTVNKRPTTVPRSPLLGLRRFTQHRMSTPPPSTTQAVSTNTGRHQQESQPSTGHRSPASSHSRGSSVTSLIGLHLVESGSKIEVLSSRDDDPSLRPPLAARPDDTNTAMAPDNNNNEYRPHSTMRAEQRAQFQAKKLELEKERQEKLSKQRQEKVRTLKRELKALQTTL